MIRKETHTRGNYAALCFYEYSQKLGEWTKTNGSIIGNTPQRILKKLNQANRIWHHYANEYSKK